MYYKGFNCKWWLHELFQQNDKNTVLESFQLAQDQICLVRKSIQLYMFDVFQFQKYVDNVVKMLCFWRCPSGMNWLCSRQAWKSTGRRLRTVWTPDVEYCSVASTDNIALPISVRTQKIWAPSATISPACSSWTTVPVHTGRIPVKTTTFELCRALHE